MQRMAMVNIPKFLEAWQQKDKVPKDNYLQLRVISWLKFIEDHDYGWIAHDASITIHL
jgi:hypothetical protein